MEITNLPNRWYHIMLNGEAIYFQASGMYKDDTHIMFSDVILSDARCKCWFIKDEEITYIMQDVHGEVIDNAKLLV